MKLLAGLLGGLLLAILGTLLELITFAAGDASASQGLTVFFGCWLGGAVLALTAPRAAKAWRRLLITSAIFSFLLPLSGLVYTGAFMASRTDGSAAATAGAAIGGGLLSGALGFFGFFLGVVFLIVGLLVGRDPQVIYVQQAADLGDE